MFLSMNHPFRAGRYLGLNSSEYTLPPPCLNGNALVEKLRNIEYISGKFPKAPGRKRKPNDIYDNDKVEAKEAWYKRSIFFDLEY